MFDADSIENEPLLAMSHGRLIEWDMPFDASVTKQGMTSTMTLGCVHKIRTTFRSATKSHLINYLLLQERHKQTLNKNRTVN